MEHSTTHPRIVPIAHTHPSVSNKSIFVVGLAFFGVCSILTGIITFVSVIILLSTRTLPDPASTMVIQAAYDLSVGVLIVVSARLFAKGKLLSIWLYGGSMVIDSLYHLIMGYPLNYLFLGFGFLLLWQILKVRNELDLA